MTIPRSIIRLAVACTGLCAIPGCGPERKQSVPAAQIAADPKLAEGQSSFMHHCHQCHPRGGGGLAPGIVDKPLPALAIKTQVRQGVGTMPAFSERHISDQELDALVAYIQVLRDQPPLASR